jgi:hypothetical protein
LKICFVKKSLTGTLYEAPGGTLIARVILTPLIIVGLVGVMSFIFLSMFYNIFNTKEIYGKE